MLELGNFGIANGSLGSAGETFNVKSVDCAKVIAIETVDNSRYVMIIVVFLIWYP
jgi:hypothetical protein